MVVATLTKEQRQAKRLERQHQKQQQKARDGSGADGSGLKTKADDRERLVQFLSKNEHELLEFVVKVNKLYEEKLGKPAPFMTFVLIGMQSSGKSTFMERLLNAVLNIVQEGTGTRCPLDVTCMHDESSDEPRADLSGEELDGEEGLDLPIDKVFERITDHNKRLEQIDSFSTKSLKLVYRAKNVRNMRFVDTPGIISNRSTGKDNREDIKDILQAEMVKPNTKLCVLLEATEYAKNPIIAFLDDSLGGRKGWVDNATFLMPKFDKQMEDSRTANKANNFFSEFIKNRIEPHLVITPTLEREDLPSDQLYVKRNELLKKSNGHEEEAFNGWLQRHKMFREEEGGTDSLDIAISQKIGFPNAQEAMGKEMLEHTLETLPTVLGSLQKELAERQVKLQDLKERQKFTDPRELKLVVNNMLHSVQERLAEYLDGDLLSSIKYSDRLQTLEEEIDDEEESYWATKELNFHSDKDDSWRSHIAEMECFPEEIQPEKRFLGGKQVHRAIECFRYVMIDSLPDPFELSDLVANAVGYGGGSLMRENWERATMQICKVLMQDVTHPGINFLVKHIGFILRRLFFLALEDIKEGQEFSKTFRIIPGAVESFLENEFDSMLWGLMEDAAKKIHTALEPLYSTVDPNLPTFHPCSLTSAEDREDDEELDQEGLVKSTMKRLTALLSGNGAEAKTLLKEENRARAESKKAFLCDERTSMITDEETKKILNRSFQYLVALMEYSLTWFRLQINHFLYEAFKTEMKKSFVHKCSDANWEELVQPDPSVAEEIDQLKDQIKGLEASLQDVQRMNQRIY